jgi:hypothetical protein
VILEFEIVRLLNWRFLINGYVHKFDAEARALPPFRKKE